MALVKPAVFQVAGYANSGKTTILSNLIKNLAAEGLSVVTIKHHGHGGKPLMPDEKDSEQHLAAGARASLVEGAGKMIISSEGITWSLAEKIGYMSSFGADFVLIEGHKHERYPKLVIVRNQEDCSLLDELVNIQAVFYWDWDLIKNWKRKEQIPSFHIRQEEGYAWLIKYLKKQLKNS